MRSNLLQQAVILSGLLLVKTTSRTHLDDSINQTAALKDEYFRQNILFYGHIPGLITSILKDIPLNETNQANLIAPKDTVVQFLQKYHKQNGESLETIKDEKFLRNFSFINNLFKLFLNKTFKLTGIIENYDDERRSCGLLYYLIYQLPNRNIIECFYNRILNNFKKLGAESELLETITIELNTVIGSMKEAARERNSHGIDSDRGQVDNFVSMPKPTKMVVEQIYFNRCLPALLKLLHHAFMFFNIAFKKNSEINDDKIDLRQHVEAILDIQTMNRISILLCYFQNSKEARRHESELYDLEKTIFEYFEKRLSKINVFDNKNDTKYRFSQSKRVLQVYYMFEHALKNVSEFLQPNSSSYNILINSIAERILAVEYEIPRGWEAELTTIA